MSCAINSDVRNFFERGLQQDFSQVRLSYAVGSHFPAGRLAATVGNRVYLNRNYFSPCLPIPCAIIGHELVLVAQKRSSRDPIRSECQLEAEADLLTHRVLNGERVQVIECDKPENPWFWDPAGHYWAPYLVLVAAGVNADVAQRAAFFAEMPDKVNELDAMKCV